MKKIKWTFEACKAEALKYTHRRSFKINSGSAYTRARENKWLDEICIHMTPKQKPNGYWTLEKCRIEALKYSTVKEYRKNSGGSYNTAYQNKWLKEVCSHMRMCKPNNYWTKEVCKQEALKYTDYEAFNKNSSGAVGASRAGGWFEEITSHFKVKGNRHKRFIYAYEFPDNHVYVGLTHNITERQNNHLVSGSVFEHVQNTNLKPEFKQLTENPVEVDEARKLEGKYLSDYVNNGWIKLNKVKTGAVGRHHIKWDYGNCKKEALKYSTFSEFRLGNKSAYNSALKNKWLYDICSHIKKSRKPAGYFTLEVCIEIAKDCTSIYDMQKRYGTASRKVYTNGWASIIKEHLIKNATKT